MDPARLHLTCRTAPPKRWAAGCRRAVDGASSRAAGSHGIGLVTAPAPRTSRPGRREAPGLPSPTGPSVGSPGADPDLLLGVGGKLRRDACAARSRFHDRAAAGAHPSATGVIGCARRERRAPARSDPLPGAVGRSARRTVVRRPETAEAHPVDLLPVGMRVRRRALPTSSSGVPSSSEQAHAGRSASLGMAVRSLLVSVARDAAAVDLKRSVQLDARRCRPGLV